MSKGGRQPGAGRPKGSTTRVRVSEFFTEKEKKSFFNDLKVRAKTDTKIALYLAEQMTGKAMQTIEGDFKGNINISFDNAFTSSKTEDNS